MSKDNVPPYARWFVAPGALLPIVTDPNDAGRAQVDWPELAERTAVAGGTWQDPPPEGCIAALLLMAVTGGESVLAASIGGGAGVTPTVGSSEVIEGVTVERCAYVEAALKPDSHSMSARVLLAARSATSPRVVRRAHRLLGLQGVAIVVRSPAVSPLPPRCPSEENSHADHHNPEPDHEARPFHV